jgi:hypothetical protein
LTALPVAKVVVDLGVAGTAKAHQIVSRMSAALRDGNDVMHFLDGSVPTFLEAAFAQRVCRSVAVSDSFPTPAVFLIAVGSAFVTVVIVPHGFPVFLTVGTVREPTASGIAAWSFRFPWHPFTSLSWA